MTDEQRAQELAEKLAPLVSHDALGDPFFDDRVVAALLLPLVQDAERWKWWRQRWATHVVTFLFGNRCVDRTIEDAEAAIDRARSEGEAST